MNTKQAQAKAKARRQMEAACKAAHKEEVQNIATMLNEHGPANVKLMWSSTQLLKVQMNTEELFKAELKDSMGAYQATIQKIGSKLKVILEGVCNGLYDVEYTKWNWSMIWADIKKQGTDIKVLGN